MKKLFILSLCSLMAASGIFAQRTSSINTENLKTKAVTAVLDPSSLKYEAGERCEIEYKGDWLGGMIEAVNTDGSYTVSWDGYAESYNSKVEKSRLRALTPIKNVPYIVVKRDAEAVLVKGNIKDGSKIDLKWAENSAVACFPGTRFKEFLGNHKFYWMDLPKNSQVFIRVNAPNGERINVYAYSGFDGEKLPPNVVSCVSCEAGYEQWSPTNTPTDFTKSSGPQKVQLRAVNNRYRVLIAVAGADGVLSGEYKMRVEIEPYP